MNRVIYFLLFGIIFVGGVSIPTFSQAQWGYRLYSYCLKDPMEGKWVNDLHGKDRDITSISRAVYDPQQYCYSKICPHSRPWRVRPCHVGYLQLWLNCRLQSAPNDCSYRGRVRVYWDNINGYYTERYPVPPSTTGRVVVQSWLKLSRDPIYGDVLSIKSEKSKFGGPQEITDLLRRSTW